MKLATDIGGTFTDLVSLDETTGDYILAKALSTPPRFSQGIMDAIHKSGLDPATVTGFMGCGGGWGDPAERDADAVRADLRAGLISPETAQDVYGLTDKEA